MVRIPTQKEVIELAKLLATPIDFEALEKTGVIERHGSWFKLLDLKALPEHALKQARAIKSDNKGNSYIQFPKSWKKAQQLYKRMTGKEYNE
jgi:hypothetical protein